MDTSVQSERRRWLSLLPVLRCPACHRPLSASAAGVGCGTHVYPVRDGVPVLLRAPAVPAPAPPPGLRERVWRYVPGPVTPARQRRLLGQFLAETAPGARPVLNVGAGDWDVGHGVFNVDCAPYASVDLVADIHDLPFADGSIGAIICMGTLEHIEQPEAAVAECFRLLAPGGRVFCTVPFLQAYHEAPADFQRWTRTGVERLFRDFAQPAVRPSHGAGSAFTWIAAEYFSTLLSCGVPKLQTLWLIVWRYLLAPFKWTDALTERWSFEHRVSSGFLIVARKPWSPPAGAPVRQSAPDPDPRRAHY